MKTASSFERFNLSMDIADQAMTIARLSLISPIAKRHRDRYLAQQPETAAIRLPDRHGHAIFIGKDADGLAIFTNVSL